MIRGKILRDTASGTGLASAQGQQHPFSLEQHWRSDDVPTVGMAVDIELSAVGALLSLRPVSVQQQTQESLRDIGRQLQDKGLPVLKTHATSMVSRVGWIKLALLGALAVGWLGFATLTVRLGGNLSQSLSLHDLLQLVNAGTGLDGLGSLRHGSAGWYGLAMWLALLAPLLPDVWHHRWAPLSLFAPLGFMLLTGAVARAKISAGTQDAGAMAGAFGGPQAAAMAQRMADEMLSQIMQAISLGFGFYLALAAALVLAALGARALLFTRPAPAASFL
ncbi:MAG: hypothetical protein ACKVOT_08105 [Polaromonas sp.]